MHTSRVKFITGLLPTHEVRFEGAVPHGRGSMDVGLALPVQDVIRLAKCLEAAGAHLVGHAVYHYQRPELPMPCPQCEGDVVAPVSTPETLVPATATQGEWTEWPTEFVVPTTIEEVARMFLGRTVKAVYADDKAVVFYVAYVASDPLGFFLGNGAMFATIATPQANQKAWTASLGAILGPVPRA